MTDAEQIDAIAVDGKDAAKTYSAIARLLTRVLARNPTTRSRAVDVLAALYDLVKYAERLDFLARLALSGRTDLCKECGFDESNHGSSGFDISGDSGCLKFKI